MIKELKLGEEYKYYSSKDIRNVIKQRKDMKMFVNSENFVHNDVGPACIYGNRKNWYWNGIDVE